MKFLRSRSTFLIIVIMMAIPAIFAVISTLNNYLTTSSTFFETPTLNSITDGISKTNSCNCGMLHKLWLDSPRMVGEQIKEAQEALKQLGFYFEQPDGIFGETTRNSIIQFQISQKITPDGVLNFDTWSKLAQAYEKIAETVSIPIENKAVISDMPESVIVIDTSTLKLTLYKNGEVVKTYTVCVGAADTPTPLGTYKIKEKRIWSGGFGSRWMGLDVPWGTYGIHGTNKPWSIGNRKSGGCIRMLNKDVNDLYSRVSIGTVVVIIGGGNGDHGMGRPTIEPGAKGWHVLIVQKELKERGFYHGSTDGVYGISTEKAVIEFQKSAGLKTSGIVDWTTYDALGMILFE